MTGADAAPAPDGGDRAPDGGFVDVEDVEDVGDVRPRLVRFALGTRSFLVDVAVVREVLVASPCTRLPGSAPALVGVTSVRGRIVAVVDPRAALAADGDRADPGRFLVVTTGDGDVALLVDRVDDVVPAEPDPVGPPAGPDPGGPVGLAIVATAGVDGAVLPVLDPEALVAAALHDGADLAPEAAVP